MLGIVSGAGSLGALLSAPLGQMLNEGFGWRVGLAGFVDHVGADDPCGLVCRPGRRDSAAEAAADDIGDATAATAAKTAFGNASFVVMTCAYFVCGMQLVFLTTHLPSYLAICGLDPMLSAQTLGMIGGFNVLGSCSSAGPASAGTSWRCWAASTSCARSRSPGTSCCRRRRASTLLFGAIMGFLWMGVGPLVAGAVAEMFGLRWQAMIQGLAFMSHQIGSFLGAYGGGVLYDTLGSYTMAWRIGVALGLAGGIIQVAFALIRPSQPPMVTARWPASDRMAGAPGTGGRNKVIADRGRLAGRNIRRPELDVGCLTGQLLPAPARMP